MTFLQSSNFKLQSSNNFQNPVFSWLLFDFSLIFDFWCLSFVDEGEFYA